MPDQVPRGRWVVPERLVEGTLGCHRHLTDGQRHMVRSFATSGNTVDVGVGPAGSGKTAVVGVISELASVTGTPIVGAALAARAAAGLETATGIPSTTLSRLLSQTGDQHGLPPGAVVMSRRHKNNTLYLAGPRPDEHCAHLIHPPGRDPVDQLTTALARSSAQTAGPANQA